MLLFLLIHTLLAGQPSGPGQIPGLPQKTADRTTGTACGIYARPSTQSPMLSIVPSGVQVQVTDSSNNAYFVRAAFTKDGKVVSGYMFRACLSSAP